jgi:multiple sugar transport system permease protein
MRALSKRHTAWLLAPWAVSFALFWLFPLLFALYLAFTRFSPLSGDLEPVGAVQFVRLWSDGDFWQAVRNTLVFVAGTVPVTTALALGLALLLNSRIRGRGFFRAAFFFPSITALVVVALVWTALYARGGVLSSLVSAIGLSPPEHGFLLSTSTALPAIMLLDIWAAVGYYMLLYLAALQALPAEYYESARLLAATPWQTLRFVIWPALRPMTFLVLVLNTIKSFQVFVEVYVMTRGGPMGSTRTLVYFVYDEGLAKFDMGYASAAAFSLFALVALVSWILARRLGFGKEIAV